MQIDGFFEGGGVKGIALVRALTRAEKEGFGLLVVKMFVFATEQLSLKELI